MTTNNENAIEKELFEDDLENVQGGLGVVFWTCVGAGAVAAAVGIYNGYKSCKPAHT